MQTAKAVFTFLVDGIRFVDFGDFAFRVPAHRTLGKHVRARAFPFFQGASDHFFRVPDAVDGGGVDPVDAELESAVNGGDGVGILLRPPAKVVAHTADGPGAESYGRNVQV